MRSGSKVRKTQNETAAYAIEHSTVNITSECPVLHQIAEAGEFNLLDLPHLQTELEHLLAAATQRMTCISHHLRGLSISLPILRSLGLAESDPNNRPQHPCETGSNSSRKTTGTDPANSLVVTRNPENPLSLIISQKKELQQQQSQQKTGIIIDGRNKSREAPASTNAIAVSPAVSPHDIPNRFWSLMEPYCADITESNISYLESILKSYVEEATTSKYFLLPQSKSIRDSTSAECISPKRLRRDTLKIDCITSEASDAPPNQDQISEAFKAASEVVALARQIDGQLKISGSIENAISSRDIKPSSSPSVERLLCSLENDLYENNVSSVLREAVAQVAQGLSPKFATETHRPIQDNNGGDNLTSMCSQPLKDLARQFQVSSSFRVEKKISQATEELGLFPLTLYLNHLSHRPDKPLISIPEKPTVPLVLPSPQDHQSTVDNHSEGPLVNDLNHSKGLPAPSPSSSQSNIHDHSAAVDFSNSQPNGFCASPRQETENGEAMSATTSATTKTNSSIRCNQEGVVVAGIKEDEEDTSPANAEMDGSSSNSDANVEGVVGHTTLAPLTPSAEPDTNSDCPHSLDLRVNSKEVSDSSITIKASSLENHINSQPGSTASPIKSSPHSANCNGGEGSEWFTDCLPRLDDTDGDDLSSCLLNLNATNSFGDEAVGGGYNTDGNTSTDQLTRALIRRQRELRLVCAANHNLLHRLIQAARRDLQRQEIQRRLAVADADVIEAYNKLESYKVHKRPVLKRDRDFAWKALKERQKIRAELDAFDKKPP